ncbi:MAG: AAA family ATPase [Parcubacteria group bacterium]
MARILATINAKGGVGKTTTAINLGAYLAASGKYVLLVDLDPQANATAGLGIEMADHHGNLYHSLIGDKEPNSLIRRSSILGFDVLPAAASLAGANVELISMEDRETKLKEVLDKVRTNYDYIIIDSPPSLGILTINGLVAAEGLIIPVQCEYYALEGLGQLTKTIDLVRQQLNPQLQIYGVLPTMYDRRNTLSRQVLNELQKKFSGRVFESIIPRSVSLAEAPGYGKSILQFDEGSRGARAYRDLAREVIQLT